MALERGRGTGNTRGMGAFRTGSQECLQTLSSARRRRGSSQLGRERAGCQQNEKGNPDSHATALQHTARTQPPRITIAETMAAPKSRFAPPPERSRTSRTGSSDYDRDRGAGAPGSVAIAVSDHEPRFSRLHDRAFGTPSPPVWRGPGEIPVRLLSERIGFVVHAGISGDTKGRSAARVDRTCFRRIPVRHRWNSAEMTASPSPLSVDARPPPTLIRF